jgi:hypothetical protein
MDHVSAFAIGALPAGVGITGGVIAGTPVTVQTAAGIPPTITQNTSIDDNTDTWGLSSDQSGGALNWARLDAGGASSTADGAGGWNGTVPYMSAPLEIDAGGTTDLSYKLVIYHRNNVLTTLYTADNKASVVTIQTLTPGNGTANVVASTMEGNGTLYWLLAGGAVLGNRTFPQSSEDGQLPCRHGQRSAASHHLGWPHEKS